MGDIPKSYSKMQQSNSSKDINYTFPIQSKFILQDLMRRGILQPLDKVEYETPLGHFLEAYYAYH